MLDQPGKPAELVVELRPRLWIAIRRVQACNEHAADRGFEVPRLAIGGVARQHAAHLDRLVRAREDRNAVVTRLLALPQRAVATRVYRGKRELLVVDAQLLQADDIRARLIEPLGQPRQAATDAVDVERRDSHGRCTRICRRTPKIELSAPGGRRQARHRAKLVTA